MRWRKRLAVTLGVCAALVLVIMGGLTWMLGSERGTAWLISVIGSAVPSLAVGRVEGTLLTGVELGDVTILVKADRIEAREVEVTLAWSSLLKRVVVVERFHASAVSYTRAPATGEAGELRLPELPFIIEIRNADVDSFTVESPQDRLTFAELSLAARLSAGELVVERVEVGLQGGELSGSITLDTRDGMRLDAGVDWRAPNARVPAAGRFMIEGTLPELTVRHELDAPYAVSTAGKLWVESPPRIALGFEWAAISIPGREDLGAIRGTAGVEGTVDALRFTSNGVLAALESELTYSVRGSIEGPVVHVEPLTVTGPGGSVAVVGEIAIDTLDWTASVEGRGIDPGAYDARLAGNVDLAAELRGQLRPALQITAESASLSGTLRELPFAATAAGTFEYPNRWRIDELAISSDADLVRASGTVDEQLDVAVDARIARLERWWPGISGSIAADVTARGALRAPRIAGTTEARALELRGYRVEAATLAGDVVVASDGAIDVTLTAADVSGPGFVRASLRAGVDGSIDAHGIDIALEDSRWSTDFAARGGLEAGIWRGAVETVDIRERELGAWRLRSRTDVEIGRDHVVLAPACLVQSGTDVCATVRLTGAADDEIVLSASNFDIEALQPFLPEGVALNGVYELSAALTDLRGAQRGHLALSGGATRVRLALGERDVLDRVIESVTLNADLESGRLDLDFAVDGGDAGGVDLEAIVADVREPSSSVAGKLEVEWRDLEPLSLLSPDVGSVAGNVTAELALGGTLAEPELEGHAELADGAIEVPVWELTVENISGTAVTVDGTMLEYSGSGLVEGKTLHLTGRTELDPARNWPTRLRINGEDLEIIRRADAEISASPDLEIDVNLPDIVVQGTVHVPYALITLEQLPAQAVRPSADATVHGVARDAPERPLHVSADVRMTLGDNVHYNAGGLRTDVEGELGLHYESGLTPTAAGSLRLLGTYNAYGQTLELERGQLLFTGPLNDPAINVRAERTIGDTTVGVQLTGALKAPSTRIYSEPAMSEADALSYLLLGRPLSGTGEQETATLESAALAMGLQQALPAVQRFGTTLGLDELSIQSNDQDSGALTAGKYLSPRLYVRYSYGLFSRLGGLLVRFSVNDKLAVEARSGDEDSVDLLYTVERE